MCVFVHIYTYIYIYNMCVCVCVCVCMWEEREGCYIVHTVCVCFHVHTLYKRVHIYTYIRDLIGVQRTQSFLWFKINRSRSTISQRGVYVERRERAVV